MTDPPTAELPIGVPEADLLEQRTPIDRSEPPEDAVTVVSGRVAGRIADEADLLEQAQAAGVSADDDDHPYDSPAARE